MKQPWLYSKEGYIEFISGKLELQMTRNIMTCVTGLISPRALFCPIFYQRHNRSDDPLQRYDHWKFSKMAADRHLVFGPAGSSIIRSADFRNKPYPSTSHESINPS